MSITSDLRGVMRERLVAAELEYAELGWPTVLAHRPLVPAGRCSCGRVTCPTPGAHPASPSWRHERVHDADAARQRRSRHPDANLLLATGHRVDAVEVPASAGAHALDRLETTAGALLEPVAVNDDTYVFFVDSWHGPSNPEHRPDAPRPYAVRWHAAGSYVLVPPSATPSGGRVFWLRRPSGRPLPDPMLLIDALVAACTRLRPTVRRKG